MWFLKLKLDFVRIQYLWNFFLNFFSEKKHLNWYSRHLSVVYLYSNKCLANNFYTVFYVFTTLLCNVVCIEGPAQSLHTNVHVCSFVEGLKNPHKMPFVLTP